MLNTDEIKLFIDRDKQSKRRQQAIVGARYYDADHDIKNFKFYYVDDDGELVEDMHRSNAKIPHPFFTELVDQQVQYMLSGGKFIKSNNDMPELQSELDHYFDESFIAECANVLQNTISEGYSYMYAYQSTDQRIKFESAEGISVVEVKEKDTSDHCRYVIYSYKDYNTRSDKMITRIQVWNDEKIWFYIQDDSGNIVVDDSELINPRPHVIYQKPNDDSIYYDTLGVIPFFRLDNNRKQLSGLHPIKTLIDDYDLMACGLSNNINDAVEALTVVTGFEGDNIGELVNKVKNLKYIGVAPGGDVNYRTVQIPHEARSIKLSLDENNIYRFGMGFNSTLVGDGNVTNVVIKSRYALLDLKCNKLEKYFKSFLRQLINLALTDINKRNGTGYNPEDVKIEFTRETITNASDNAAIEKVKAETKNVQLTMLLNLAGKLPDDTILKKICDIMDIDYEEIKNKMPKNEIDDTTAAVDTLNQLGDSNAQ